MTEFVVGVGRVTLHLRHAQSLKDKRRAVQSLIQKLRNEGFSVTESAYADDPKRGSVGYSFAGSSPSFVRRKLEEVDRLLIGEYTVVEHQRDVLDYGSEDAFTENPYRFLADEED
jgi:uncharacterized protein YlxP (DUF503 family)